VTRAVRAANAGSDRCHGAASLSLAAPHGTTPGHIAIVVLSELVGAEAQAARQPLEEVEHHW
jgi:hypothetical protein